MKCYIGVTDYKWFSYLSSQPHLDEVNFWQPGGKLQFRALDPGELFLFKLHSPNNFIVGGGIFAHSSLIPISLAWESFGNANGSETFTEMRNRVAAYRNDPNDRTADFRIGCILLEQPFFLQRDQWISVPPGWSSNIVQGKTYNLSTESGQALWNQLQSSLSVTPMIREEVAKYGQPVLTMPRLGQGTFRLLVTDAYERKCAITNERTLPALDAAHIKPYSANGGHEVRNGILLRRDLHALFDRGYITIAPDLTIEVSRRIREEYENGRDYYRYQGNKIRIPIEKHDQPSLEYLQWHNNNIYKG